jgi:hypothetical protein
MLSIVVPFVQIPVEFSVSQGKPAALWQTLTVIPSTAESKHSQIAPENISALFTLKNSLILIYLVVAFAIFTRLAAAFIFVGNLLRKYTVERTANIYFVNTEEPTAPFSYFKWLFWNKKIDLRTDNGKQIYRHELFHIQQKHSWDLTFLELTTAVFWINPFFHLIKKEAKTIHEFLADEFATTDDDKWSYAELLLMQVLGSSSNRLVNPFFQNQIKRRIAMITSSKTPKYQFFRKLMILPIAAFVFVLFAFKMESHADKRIAQSLQFNAISSVGAESKVLALDAYAPALDTAKPKESQETKKTYEQKVMDAKARQAQASKELFKKTMAEKKEREMDKYQEQFKKMMEMSQREAAESQEKLKMVLEQREKESAQYQEQFKKMMEGGQKEGQEKFKQLSEERQKEAAKFQEQFKQMWRAKQIETKTSQQELKKLLEDRRLEMQQFQDEFKQQMMLMQEKERAKKQVI